MKPNLILTALGGLLATTSPAFAGYVTSPTTVIGGMVAVLNTTSGVISMCYRLGSNTPLCVTAGNFTSPSAASQIISNEGSPVFFIVDTNSGRTVRCEYGTASATSSGWTCLQVAATLP